MEWRIGEIFKYNGEWYQCIVGYGCENCAFYERKCYGVIAYKEPIGDCCADRRKDNEDVIFKKLEKVGEIYEENGRLFQKYKVHRPVVGINEDELNTIIAIEIKQTKEDMGENNDIRPYDELFSQGTVSNTKHLAKEAMEEKKVKLDKLVTDYTSNKITYNEFEKAVKDLYADKEESKPSLKSFSLEAAKQGKPVCTRDGRKARIIAFDRRLFYKNVSYPILALVERSDGEDDVCGYNEKGKALIEDCAEYKDDLMMLTEKKEGWVNIYRSQIYNTPEKAKEAYKRTCNDDNYLQTIKIEYEE